MIQYSSLRVYLIVQVDLEISPAHKEKLMYLYLSGQKHIQCLPVFTTKNSHLQSIHFLCILDLAAVIILWGISVDRCIVLHKKIDGYSFTFLELNALISSHAELIATNTWCYLSFLVHILLAHGWNCTCCGGCSITSFQASLIKGFGVVHPSINQRERV